MLGFDYKKAIQSLNWLAIKSGGHLNKMKALKLIWLSDRYHLREYGRLITNDNYFALPFGPVPSATRDILQASPFRDDEIALSYSKDFLATKGEYEFESKQATYLNVFSESDLEVLVLIYSRYGQLSEFELSEISHHFPEWKRFEGSLASKLVSRESIDILDFFIDYQDSTHLFEDKEGSVPLIKAIYEETAKMISDI